MGDAFMRRLILLLVSYFIAASFPVVGNAQTFADGGPPSLNPDQAEISAYEAAARGQPSANSEVTSDPSDISPQTIENLKRECEDDLTTAKNACGNPTSTAGMSPMSKITFGEKLMLLGQLSQLVANVSGNSKICTIAAGLSGAANTVATKEATTTAASKTTATAAARNAITSRFTLAIDLALIN